MLYRPLLEGYRTLLNRKIQYFGFSAFVMYLPQLFWALDLCNRSLTWEVFLVLCPRHSVGAVTCREASTQVLGVCVVL